MTAATLRTEMRPGDIGWIVARHGEIYAEEHGFDHRFEAYVAGPLGDCVRALDPRDRIWVAERDGRRVGCVAIVGASMDMAQLRWLLVEPDARGGGLGRRLLREAVAFCREREYASVILWTVSALTAAAHLYEAIGFARVETKPVGRPWGVDVVEEKYALSLR